ncbi:MAG: hypothetical protein U1E30_07080 [Rhodoblastus sp.]
MNIKRRAAVTGLFGWMALLAFSPLLDWKKPGSGFTTGKKLGKLTVIYVGAEDCAPCIRWRRERKPEFQASLAFERVEYREVIAPKLSTALEDQFWPEALRSLRPIVQKGGGGVPYWIVMRQGRVVAAAGGESAWKSQIWPLIVMEA